MSLSDFYTSLGVLAMQDGYTDFLAIVRDTPTEPIYTCDISSLAPTAVVPVNSFGVNVSQNPFSGAKYAGEGPDPQTFRLPQTSITASLAFPLLSPCYGWVDPPFAHFWHHALLAYRGTATAPWAGTPGSNTLPGTITQLTVDNVADFLPLTPPFATSVRTAGTDYPCTVQSVSKSSRLLILDSAYAIPLDAASTVRATFASPDYFQERGFTLVSMREGVMRPCLVKSMEVRLPSSGDAEVTVEVSCCRLFRGQQPAIRAAYDSVESAVVQLPVARRVMSPSVSVEGLSAPSWSFGLGSPVDDPAFAGFQGLSADRMVVTDVTFKIENNIVEINTLHGLDPTTSVRDTQFPMSLACESRTISGEMTYRSHLKPWALAEKLSGPSTAGLGGIKLNVDTFAVSMPLVAWEPSSGSSQADGYHERKLKWTCVADDYDDPPRLEYPS